MPGRPFEKNDPRQREAARKGGAASAAKKAAARMTKTAAIKARLGPLETIDDALRWLHEVAAMMLGGDVSGTVGRAALDAVKAWISVNDLQGKLRNLEHRLARLEKTNGG